MSIVSKMNVIFDLTNSFKDAYNPKTKETQIQKVLESRLADNSIEISNISITARNLIGTHHIMTLIMKS